MKKIIIALMMLCTFAAYAENENAATSKEYVDTELATKQQTIPAAGNNVVMTFDGTADDGIGTKNIYDPSGSYATQQDALVTAATANAAMQMAINGEFYCKEWSTLVENDCWLWGIKEPTPHASGKNLLDPSFMDKSTYNITVDGFPLSKGRILPTENGKTYTLSATLTYKGSYYYYIRGILPDGTTFIVPNGEWMWHSNSGTPGTSYKTFTFTAKNDANYVVFFAITSSLNYLTLSNYQMEEGSTATAYEPYKNLYIPQNVQ